MVSHGRHLPIGGGNVGHVSTVVEVVGGGGWAGFPVVLVVVGAGAAVEGGAGVAVVRVVRG